MDLKQKLFVIKVNRQSVLVIAYIAFLINYILNGYEFGTPVETVLFSTTVVSICSLVQKRISSKGFYIQGALLIITAILSVSVSNVMSISGSRIWNYVFCVMVYVLISTTYIEPGSFRTILQWYLLVSSVLSIFVIIGYIFGFGIDTFGRASISYGEFFKDQNYLAAYYMPAFSYKMYQVIIEKKRNAIDIILLFFFVLSVLLMGSRGAFLTELLIMFIIVLNMLLFDRNIVRKFGLIILLIVGTIIIYFVFSRSPLFQRMTGFESYGSDVRLRLWMAGLSGFRNNIWLGSGIGSASMYSWSLIGNAVHNCFIEIISDHGIIGALLIIWSFLRMITVPKGKRLLVISFFIGLFGPLFFLTGYSNMTFWMPMFFLQNFISYQRQIVKGE